MRGEESGMNNTQSKVFMTGVWINYNMLLLLLVSSAALLCISHARSLRSEHVVQQPQGREIIRTAWRIDDLSVMNGLTPQKPAVGGSEFTREQGHPRQPLSTPCRNTSTPRPASPMALFPPLETHFAAGNIQCTFVLPTASGLIFPSLIVWELRCQC